MISLNNISYYSNFGAHIFHHVPADRFIISEIDLDIFPLADACHSSSGRRSAIWVFGARVVTTRDVWDVHTFGLDAIDSMAHRWHHRIIADSWSFLDELVLLADEDPNPLHVILDVGFLGNLYDPRPILAALKRIMLRRTINCYFIWGDQYAVAIRAWEKEKFKYFLTQSGFRLTDVGGASSIIAATLSIASYREYLEEAGFKQSAISSDYLIITTEDASIQRTGGIGTYVANIKQLNPACIVLFAAAEIVAKSDQRNTIFAEQILGAITHEQMFEGDGILEALRTLIYTLPALAVCEFQDYQSIGFRLVQAKETLGLPRSLGLRVFLHGNLDYVKFAIATHDEAFYSKDEVRSVIKDKYIFRTVDQVMVPSQYLSRLMVDEYGYDLNNPVIQRLPFDLKSLSPPPSDIAYKKPTMLVYIGKFSPLKGWPDFIDAIISLKHDPSLRLIEKLTVLAPGQLSSSDRSRLEEILPCEHFHLNHVEMLNFLRENRATALFVVPSGGENYPFVFLELLLSACRVIGYRRGGALEVIEDISYLEEFFVEPNPIYLARKIASKIDESPSKYTDIIGSACVKAWRRQEEVNQVLASTIQIQRTDGPDSDISNLDKISIVTPVYNTPERYLDDLRRSIESSAIQPKEWIIVNDGSEPEYTSRLTKFVNQCTRLPCKLVHQRNLGLAGARNRGLLESRTPLTYFIDSDDVLLPHTLTHTALAISSHSGGLLAVSGYAVYFDSLESLGSDVDAYRKGRYWKPLGTSEARSISILQNEFITANSMVNTALALELGGWDQSDKATWEDWAFFLRATWSGFRILLMPWPGYLYRNTPGSMSKVYNRFFGVRRLARNLGLLDRFEANILISLVQTEQQEREYRLRDDSASQELRAIYRSRSWRYTKPIRALRRQIGSIVKRVLNRI